MNENAIGFVEEQNFVAQLTDTRATMFSSLKAETPAQKARLFNAMNNPDGRLADCINLELSITDLFCEMVDCVNEETGEVKRCPRIVVIDEAGHAYQAVSMGVFGAFKKLISIFGSPTWNPAIRIRVKQLSKGTRNILTFEIVDDEEETKPTKKGK